MKRLNTIEILNFSSSTSPSRERCSFVTCKKEQSEEMYLVRDSTIISTDCEDVISQLLLRRSRNQIIQSFFKKSYITHKDDTIYKLLYWICLCVTELFVIGQLRFVFKYLRDYSIPVPGELYINSDNSVLCYSKIKQQDITLLSIFESIKLFRARVDQTIATASAANKILYLRGNKGIGKSMLFSSLYEISDQPPLQTKVYMGSFNDTMTSRIAEDIMNKTVTIATYSMCRYLKKNNPGLLSFIVNDLREVEAHDEDITIEEEMHLDVIEHSILGTIEEKLRDETIEQDRETIEKERVDTVLELITKLRDQIKDQEMKTIHYKRIAYTKDKNIMIDSVKEQVVEHSLSLMHTKERFAFLLSQRNRLPAEQIASKLGVKRKTIENYLKSAKLKIYDTWNQQTDNAFSKHINDWVHSPGVADHPFFWGVEIKEIGEEKAPFSQEPDRSKVTNTETSKDSIPDQPVQKDHSDDGTQTHRTEVTYHSAFPSVS